MARDVESLVLQMSADLRRFEKSMASMRATADRRLTEVERRAVQADKRLSKTMGDAGRNMVGSLKSSLAAVAPTLAAAFSAQQVIKYADSYTTLQNRLRAAGLEGKALTQVENNLYDIANRNGLQVQATAELYSRASLSRQRLGASEEQLQQLVSGTAAALKVQGTSAEAASGPLLQLGQALSGNKVQAEEYNSLIDGLPVLLQAAAKGSTRFGGDVAKLTEQVKDGKVSSQEFFAALLAGFPAIEAQAGSAATTVGSALQTLDNELGRYIGQTDQGLSATQRMAEGIILLANNLDTVTQVASALAVVMGTRFVLAMTAGSGAMIANGVAAIRLAGFQTAMTASLTGVTRAQLLATTATRTFTAALAANPIGAVIVAVTALAAGLYVLSSRYSSSAIAARELNEVTSAADTQVGIYAAAVLKARDASEANRAALLKEAEAQRILTAARIADAQVIAQKRVDEAVASRRAADRNIQQLGARRAGANDRSFSNASTSLDIGLASQTQAAINKAVRDRQEANEALQAVSRLRASSEAARNPGPIGGGGAPPAGDTKGGKAAGASGPSAEDLAAQQQMLNLQGQMELLRAQGRDAAADAAQQQIDLINLTKQYEDAGFENAKGKAEAQVSALAAAAKSAEFIEQFEKDQNRFIEEQTEALALQNDQRRDRLGYEAELARLSGDTRRIEQAERELFIEERINELLRLRPGLTPEGARAEASNEWNALDSAGVAGDLRPEVESGLRDGLRSLVDGDLKGMFAGLADSFTDRILDSLATDLADIVMSAFKPSGGGAGGGSGNWLSAIASIFTGGRKAASGRSGVTAGYPILTGERRPEVFVPQTSGSIIPSVDAAMSRANRSGGGVVQNITFDNRGALVFEAVMAEQRAYANAVASEAGAKSLAVARSVVPAEQGRRHRYSVRN